ncbi:hypothetical protein EIP86_008145 [Pleurotus ostreatoroseus]|nr:hypothetical protein EIP86_008145 [Pleurotus ostreatoroseus]
MPNAECSTKKPRLSSEEQAVVTAADRLIELMKFMARMELSKALANLKVEEAQNKYLYAHTELPFGLSQTTAVETFSASASTFDRFLPTSLGPAFAPSTLAANPLPDLSHLSSGDSSVGGSPVTPWSNTGFPVLQPHLDVPLNQPFSSFYPGPYDIEDASEGKLPPVLGLLLMDPMLTSIKPPVNETKEEAATNVPLLSPTGAAQPAPGEDAQMDADIL